MNREAGRAGVGEINRKTGRREDERESGEE